ncbi:MAG: hypothetical protein HZC45_05480 [Deltaproteobacteria bacterium]|nr:hypothetical protein [Deltaproteobacteria bacterium]
MKNDPKIDIDFWGNLPVCRANGTGRQVCPIARFLIAILCNDKGIDDGNTFII